MPQAETVHQALPDGARKINETWIILSRGIEFLEQRYLQKNQTKVEEMPQARKLASMVLQSQYISIIVAAEPSNLGLFS